MAELAPALTDAEIAALQAARLCYAGIRFDDPDRHESAMASLAGRVVGPVRQAFRLAALRELGRELKNCFPDENQAHMAQVLGLEGGTVSRIVNGQTITIDHLFLVMVHSGVTPALPPRRVTNEAVFNAAARVAALLLTQTGVEDCSHFRPLSPPQVQLLGNIDQMFDKLHEAVSAYGRSDSRPLREFVAETRGHQQRVFGKANSAPELAPVDAAEAFQNIRTLWFNHYVLWVWVWELLDRNEISLAPQ